MTISAQIRDAYVRALSELKDVAAKAGTDANKDFPYRLDDERLVIFTITSTPAGTVSFTKKDLRTNEIVPIAEVDFVSMCIDPTARRLQADEDAKQGMYNARENYANLRLLMGNTYVGSLAA
jgi:hypothetical protein